MKRQQYIANILSHYFQVVWNNSKGGWDTGNQEEIEELARVIVDEPVPLAYGTGACICGASPDFQEQAAKRMGFENWLDEHRRGKAGLAILDHRCPLHGEQAQPKLWGRHKTLELRVTADEWSSLGVTYSAEEESKNG